MEQTVTLTQSAYKDLLSRVNKLETMMVKLLKQFEKEPPYGSEAWWAWADRKGREAKKKGEYTEITTKKQLDAYFKSL